MMLNVLMVRVMTREASVSRVLVEDAEGAEVMVLRVFAQGLTSVSAPRCS